MSEFAEQLRELRKLPEPALDSELFVSRVMAACRDEEPTWRSTITWVVAATLVAAAAALALWQRDQRAPKLLVERGGAELEVAARGDSSGRISATVQAFVGRAAPGQAAALLEGAELGPGDGILVRYSNPGESRAYLMVFALDAQREVHWLHPAYLDAASDPSSLELGPSVTGQALDEVAEPENPAPGELGVFALLSDAPLTVKAVEAKILAQPAPVHELFPEAEVREWRCTWRAR